MPVSRLAGPSELVLNFKCLPRINPQARHGQIIYESAAVSDDGDPILQISESVGGAFLRLSYTDGTEFWLDRALENIWVIWPDSSSLEDTLCYLLGPIFGLLLRLRGRVCLHASAVESNGKGIVFVGCEGAGKSTTAAAFARLGSPVLSDDIVALVERESRFHVDPAYPRLNLWPSSVELLYGSADALPAITTGWEKRYLGLGQEGAPKFSNRALPIGTIYLLGDSAAVTDHGIEAVSKKDALLMLVANTYATNFLNAQQRADEFTVLSRLVDQVPVRKVNPRRGHLNVEALCELIRQDFSGVERWESRS